MDLFAGQSRSNVSLVRRFPSEDMRRRQFEFEDAFKSYIKAETMVPPRVPGSSLDTPRFVMNDGRRNLVVSDVSVSLNLDFESIPTGGILKAASSAATRMDEIAEYLKHQDEYFIGAVFDIEFAAIDSSNVQSVANDVFKHISNDNIDYISSVIGFLDGDLNYHFEIQHYSKVNVEVPPGVAGQLNIDLNFSKPDEVGFKFKVDINSKPGRFAPGSHTFSEFLELLPVKFVELAPKAFGQGIAQTIEGRWKL